MKSLVCVNVRGTPAPRRVLCFPSAKTGCPKLLQRFIHRRNRDRAPFNIHNVAAVLFKKSDFAFCGVNGDPVSECVRSLGSEGGKNLDIGDAADPLQELGHLAAFQFQLMSVGDMLVVAASAMTKIRADRVNPLGRGNDHLPELRSIKAFSAFDDFGLDSFPVDRERYKNNFSVEPADAGASERDIMNV